MSLIGLFGKAPAAPAAAGNIIAAPPRRVRISRRLMARPQNERQPYHIVPVPCCCITASWLSMSALGQKRTFHRLVDHLIGSHQHCARYCQAECFQGLFINGETETGWLLEGQIGGARSF